MGVWYLFTSAYFDWNCKNSSRNREEIKCDAIEDWLGSLVSTESFFLFGLLFRLITMAVFCRALFRIYSLIQELKKYGMIYKRATMRIHVFICVLDLLANIGIGIAVNREGINAISPILISYW